MSESNLSSIGILGIDTYIFPDLITIERVGNGAGVRSQRKVGVIALHIVETFVFYISVFVTKQAIYGIGTTLKEKGLFGRYKLFNDYYSRLMICSEAILEDDSIRFFTS
jgi:hypothetical protein